MYHMLAKVNTGVWYTWKLLKTGTPKSSYHKKKIFPVFYLFIYFFSYIR